jgi:hypothetical protein
MPISRYHRRDHLPPCQKVWIRLEEQDEEDDAIIALLTEIESSDELSLFRKTQIQRTFLVEGLKRLYATDSLIRLCQQRNLRRSNGDEFTSMACEAVPNGDVVSQPPRIRNPPAKNTGQSFETSEVGRLKEGRDQSNGEEFAHGTSCVGSEVFDGFNRTASLEGGVGPKPQKAERPLYNMWD